MSDRVGPRPPADLGLWVRFLALTAVLVAAAAGTGFWMLNRDTDPPTRSTKPAPDHDTADPPASAQPLGPTAKPFEVGGRPLFADWPKENPDLVIVVSAQTFGYLSPCGCSRPQFGGLERRYNLIAGLKKKGWEVIGVDAGDLAPKPGTGLSDQARLKYAYGMMALKEMGYVAVAAGKTEFQNGLLELLGQYTVNNADQRPIVLAANVAGAERDATGKVTKTTPREQLFAVKDHRPMVEDVEVAAGAKVSVGVVGVVAPSVGGEVAAKDPSFDFDKPAAAVPAALKKLAADKAKPELKILLYQGSEGEAMQAAKDNPEFQLVVVGGETAEGVAPLMPRAVGNTQVINVGHKGMNVGLVGVFKTANGLDLRYQLVPLGEEYLTPEKPEEVAKTHPVLQLLEKYTGEVKQKNLLAKATDDKKRGLHVAQVQNEKADLKYVGAQACAKCHANEVKKWGETKHSHAYEALEKAKRPALRQYDPECVSCHTTGFAYQTGFVDEVKTKNLLHNGCENCHGPGSGHAAKPNDKDLLKALAPWKFGDKDNKLPDLKRLEEIATLPESERGKVQLDARTQRLKNTLTAMCMQCHDGDNDPKFDFWTYMPKVYHSGLKQSDLPPNDK
jgi:hypothetical protein